jgi:hypothetical protein
VGLHGTLGENHENDVNTLTVDVLGTAVEIAAEPPLLAELQAAVVDLEPASGADRQLALVPDAVGLELRDDGHIVCRGVDPAIAVATVVWRLNAIAGQSTQHALLIHGACVAGPLGGAVLLPGGTGAGKSTLTAACVAAGLTYLTDELIALERGASSVTPYAKPLSLDDGRLVPASSLGRVAGHPATPRALVFPRYQPGAAVSETPLDPGWTLMALTAHVIQPAGLSRTALTWLAGLALTCPARQITYGDAAQVVGAIERAAEGPGRAVGAAEMLSPVTDHTTTVGMGDSLAVLHEPSGKVHLLNPSAAAMWCRAAAVDADDRSSLVGAALGAVGGERPDRSTVVATIERLVRSGLLRAPTGT